MTPKGNVPSLRVVDDELTNLEISLVARELRPDVRVVTQLGNQAIGRAMAAGNGPGAVLDVAALATPAIVEACLSRRGSPASPPSRC